MTDLYKAIRTIHNEAVTINGNSQSDIIAWDKDGNEISIDWTDVNVWVDPNEYQYKRAKEYPSIQEQLDMQYWDSVNGTTIWQDKINEIKTKYPKG
jgi:hypothetical protein